MALGGNVVAVDGTGCSIEIVSVTAVNPDDQGRPESIHITGETQNCHDPVVGIEVDNVAEVSATMTSGDERSIFRTFEADISLNHQFPLCGQNITVYAYCQRDPSCRAEVSRILNCPTPGCPAVVGVVAVGDCNNNNLRDVELKLQFSPALDTGTSVSVTWITGNGPASIQDYSINTLTSELAITEAYGEGVFFPVAVVTVQTNATSCSPLTVEFEELEVETCNVVPECPEITLRDPAIQRCVPGAVVQFQADLDPATPSPSEFIWTVRLDDGDPNATRWQKVTTQPQADTTDTWRNQTTDVNEVISFPQAGTYVVTVRAEYPNGTQLGSDPAVPCEVIDSRSFELDPCELIPCPTLTLNALAPDADLNRDLVLTATLDPSNPPADSYHWVVTLPDGRNATLDAGQSALAEVDWTYSDGTVGPLDVTQPGTYVVSVSADVSGTADNCRPEDQAFFEVEADGTGGGGGVGDLPYDPGGFCLALELITVAAWIVLWSALFMFCAPWAPTTALVSLFAFASALILWLLLCRPPACRVFRALFWASSWAAILGAALGSWLCFGISLIPIGTVLAALMGWFILTINSRQGCQVPSPFEWPF